MLANFQKIPLLLSLFLSFAVMTGCANQSNEYSPAPLLPNIELNKPNKPEPKIDKIIPRPQNTPISIDFEVEPTPTNFQASQPANLPIQPQTTRERIHVLYDANTFFDEGNFDQAKLLYEQTILDDTLLDIVQIPGDWGRNSVQSFAAFQLLFIATQDQNIVEQIKWIKWIRENSQEEWVVESANYFFSSDTTSPVEIQVACERSAKIAQEKYPFMDPWLFADLFGPILMPIDLCPFERIKIPHE